MTEMVSAVWGKKSFPITQPFGVNLPNVPDSWYAYVVDWGLPYGTHGALDISMPLGTDIYSATPGKVITARVNLEYNRPMEVVIEWTTDGRVENWIYCHLSSISVKAGQIIKAGQHIGKSGEQTVRGSWTPDGSGPHLHVERRDITHQKLLDPTPVLTNKSLSSFGSGDGNWPTVAKMDSWLKIAADNNPRNAHPLLGTGKAFMEYGESFGINPGFVMATLQRESQCGNDGSWLPANLNNFGGITDPSANGVFFRDRKWKKYPSAEAGLKGVFELLDSDIYRSTDGTVDAITKKYAPPDDGNNYTDIYNIFDAVAKHLGIVLKPDTQVYGVGYAGSGGGGFGAEVIIETWNAWWPRIALFAVGGGLIALGIVLFFGVENVAGLTPQGRIAKKIGRKTDFRKASKKYPGLKRSEYNEAVRRANS